MINFRYHLVSLIAVFLAIALGIVMGSTVVNQTIVDGLRNRIDQVERNAENRKSENDDLRAELDRVDAYVEGTQAFAVAGRLADVPIAALALRGTDGGVVKAQVELLQAAGSPTTGVLWLEPSWALPDDESVARLASAVGSSATAAERVRRAALEALADRLAAGTAAAATPVAGAPDEPADVLARLVDAGFVAVERVGDTDVDLAAFPGAEARALVLTSTASDVNVEDLPAQIATATTAAGMLTAVGDVFVDRDGGPDRGVELGSVLDAPRLADTVSTIDDIELVEGRVTAVIALEQLADGVVGHYGYGAGASRSLPPVPAR